MSIVSSKVYDPYNPFNFDVMEPLVYNSHYGGNFAASHTTFSNEAAPFVNVKIDWKETPEALVLKADIPGVKREEVKVGLEEGKVLCISVERTVEKEARTYHGYHVERSGGRFVRSFKLPENTKASKMKASIENGVLTITVPKKEVKKTHQVIHIY